MSTTTGKLNGRPTLRATVSVPKAGLWSALVEVSAPGDERLEGAAELVLGGETFKGTIVDGGPHEGRAWYRLLGGAGWRTRIAAEGYRAAGGVKLSTVAQDAARLAGEPLAPFTDRKIGPYFARVAPPNGNAEAARVLDLLAPDWYVGVDGQTHLDPRPTAAWAGKHVLLEKRPDAGRILIAPEDLVGLVPGVKIEGIEATSVRHELAAGGLRTHVYGAKGVSKRARVRAAFERLVRKIIHELFYQRSFEYRVVGQAGGYLDLEPVRESDGVPALKNVAMYVGVPGARGKPATGSTLRVSFTNNDPTLPYIASYDGEANAGWKPTHLGLEASTQADLWAPVVTLGDAAAVALAKAQLALDNFNNLKTWLDGHVHTGVTAGAGTSGPVAVAAQSPSPASMATTKVKGT